MMGKVGLHAIIQGHIGALAIDVEIQTGGGTLALVGPNGAGKTAILHMILGVRAQRAGRIVLDGVTLFDSALGIDVTVEQRQLGYVPQSYGLFPNLTAVGNVEFAIACCDESSNRSARRVQAEEILSGLGLEAIARRRPRDLSGGEKQRVALARALAARPRALLLDEPLAALDAASRSRVRTFLRNYLIELKLPAVVVTHDVRDAAVLGDRIAVVDAGRIVQVGNWDELRMRPVSPFVQQFANGDTVRADDNG